jgi:hypothetical protein
MTAGTANAPVGPKKFAGIGRNIAHFLDRAPIIESEVPQEVSSFVPPPTANPDFVGYTCVVSGRMAATTVHARNACFFSGSSLFNIEPPGPAARRSGEKKPLTKGLAFPAFRKRMRDDCNKTAIRHDLCTQSNRLSRSSTRQRTCVRKLGAATGRSTYTQGTKPATDDLCNMRW